MSTYAHTHYHEDATVKVTCNVHGDKDGVWKDGSTFAAIAVRSESDETTFFFRSLEQAQAFIAAVAGISLPSREAALV